MNQKNEVVVLFLGGLQGFIRTKENEIIHLPTNQVIRPYYDQIKAFSKDEDYEPTGTEDLMIKIGDKEYKVNYEEVIDFYLYSHCEILKSMNKDSEHKDMLKHLEYKFSQYGIKEE